ncbi:hypothetical protein WJX75_000777 [Coccomyxa subellipsoidea]|uniref:Ankyrin n=1 Tax=Coccomyxa subellipsoidea TaxID=248742 RepID=A0ABR2YFT6_9CHLO
MLTTNPLFKFGVDIEAVDADGKTALHRAAMFSDQDKVAWLLNEGLELEARDKEGVTPLHCAVFYMQRAVIKILLSRGADISTKDDQGFTPLHTAASHSSFQSHLVTADLLEAGAPLEAVDDEGRTPLLVALDRNRKEAIEVLIAAGGKTDVADKKGRTALHLAVGCSSRMVEKLLGLTVTIDAADVEGRTALHYAAQKGVKATAMVLLKAGADVQAADKLGRRALDVAEEGAHMKLAEFLRQWLLSPAPGTSSPPPSQPECSSPAAPAACHDGEPGLEEVDNVITERNSLQQQLTTLKSTHEAETSQLHQDKATLQASLRLAEDGQIAMRARLLEAERRAGAGAQLRADNADLARQAAALRGEREAAQRRSDALQLEIDVLQARNAELERQLGEQHAERVRGAAAAAANGDAQALRIRILQEANEAMAGAAAATDRAPVAAATPPLARAIQGAISSLQELPVLKERNRDTAAKPGAAKQAAWQACNQGENSGADGSRGRSAVKRVGGGYAHTPSQPTRAGPDAAARSPAKQQEEAAERPRGTPHSYVPSALKTALLRREELVLGSPSTRASTPQSRTQKWLKDNLQRSKGPASTGLKERRTPGRESFWGSARKTPSVSSKAHKSLIDRFNNPGN